MKFLVFFSYILLLFSSKCKQDVKPLNETKPCTSNCTTVYGVVLDTPGLFPLQNVNVKFYRKGYLGGSPLLIAETNTDSNGRYSFNFGIEDLKLNTDNSYLQKGSYCMTWSKDNYFKFIEPYQRFDYYDFNPTDSTFLPNRLVKWNVKLYRKANLLLHISGNNLNAANYYDYGYSFGPSGYGYYIYGKTKIDTSFTVTTAGDLNTNVGKGVFSFSDSIIVPAWHTKSYNINF